MEAAVAFPWRQLGTLLVDEGLLTPEELELGLDEQRRTGRLLGQILVDRSYLSAFSLARVLSEQHGVRLESRKDEPQPEEVRPAIATRWRPLGNVLVEGGFLTQPQLDEALRKQPHDRRLGEFLVERGLLTGAALARALAAQQGVDIPWLRNAGSELHAALKPTPPEAPVYRVYTVTFRHGFQDRKSLSESANFLEAADFAMEFVQEHEPEGLEIDRLGSDGHETVWTYSASRAAAASATKNSLTSTFGFDPTKWGNKL
jgi:hypothetical protein